MWPASGIDPIPTKIQEFSKTHYIENTVLQQILAKLIKYLSQNQFKWWGQI
jgi:hypothetical protein